MVSVSAVGLLALGFYHASGWWLAPLWVAMVFFSLGHEALLAAYGAELFPTSHRTTAAGARLLVATAGGALGLAAESLLYGWLGSHWSAVSVLLGLVLLAPLVVGIAFPETAQRVLEEIAPERAHPEEEVP
jgi:MFS family permease